MDEKQFREDLKIVYSELLHEIEGGGCDFDAVEAVLFKYGLKIDDDLSIVEVVK